MDERSLAIFLGLAAVAGVALASVRRESPAAGPVTSPDDPEPGDWGTVPDFAGDAVSFIEDAMHNVTGAPAQAMSGEGLQRLADLEGFSATPYPDYKGQSIGFGHLIQPGEGLAYVTRQDAMALLASDVAAAERTVRTAVAVPLSQAQFDALVSFTYNVGAGAFRRSTLLRKLNAGDYPGAAAEFPRWNMAGGNVLPALVARRSAEQSLFEA